MGNSISDQRDQDESTNYDNLTASNFEDFVAIHTHQDTIDLPKECKYDQTSTNAIAQAEKAMREQAIASMSKEVEPIIANDHFVDEHGLLRKKQTVHQESVFQMFNNRAVNWLHGH